MGRVRPARPTTAVTMGCMTDVATPDPEQQVEIRHPDLENNVLIRRASAEVLAESGWVIVGLAPVETVATTSEFELSDTTPPESEED